MKSVFSIVAGMGVIGLLGLVFLPIALSIYGLYLAFSASVVLGIIALFVEPSPFVLGVAALFGHSDLAHRIATWLGL